MRPIDADKLREKYIRGEIKFDDEYKCPIIDISSIIQERINEDIQEVKERIPSALYDRVSKGSML